MGKHTVFRGESGWFGIEIEGGIVYEADLSELEARYVAEAHNNGAETYEEAWAWVRENRLACVYQCQDGTCGHVDASTPECHGAACPMLP